MVKCPVDLVGRIDALAKSDGKGRVEIIEEAISAAEARRAIKDASPRSKAPVLDELGISNEKRLIYQEIQRLITAKSAQKVKATIKTDRAKKGFEEGIAKADKNTREKWSRAGGEAGWHKLTPEQRAERISKTREKRWGVKEKTDNVG